MEILLSIFGSGDELNIYQMGARAFLIFLYALVVVRIAGRRSFILSAPFDNILVILLGAILSRAVVGASPFIPTLFAGLVIAVLHRIFGILGVHTHSFGRLTKGKVIPLYKEGSLLEDNLTRSLISKNDLEEMIRLKTCADSYEGIEAIYMERNGGISVIKKEK